jgi:hypothetical protein
MKFSFDVHTFLSRAARNLTLGLNYLVLSGLLPWNAVSPGNFPGWPVSLLEVFIRAGSAAHSRMLAWHVQGPGFNP